MFISDEFWLEMMPTEVSIKALKKFSEIAATMEGKTEILRETIRSTKIKIATIEQEHNKRLRIYIFNRYPGEYSTLIQLPTFLIFDGLFRDSKRSPTLILLI